MKILFQFKVNKKENKRVEVSKEIEGKMVNILEDIVENVPKTYLIKKPTREEREEADFLYAQKISEDIRRGILTRSEVIKRFTNEDVVLKKVYDEYTVRENELQRIASLEKTPELEEKRKKLESEILELLIEIQSFELTKSSVFENTADIRARNKVLFWWILNLAYKLENNVETPLFEGPTFEEKLKSYDDLLDKEDEHLTEVVQRFFYFIPAWYSGNLSTEKQFKDAEDMLLSELSKESKDKISNTTS